MAQMSGEVRGGSYVARKAPLRKPKGRYSKGTVKSSAPKRVVKPAGRYTKSPVYKAAPKRVVKKGYTKGPSRSGSVRAPAKSKANYSTPKRAKVTSRSGGATGAGGKFYKNGYVDSKGNEVVNGKWQSAKAAPKAAPKPSAPAKASSATVSAPAPAPQQRMSLAASAPAEPVKPKVSLLADDYLDQIYRNQIAELDSADSAFGEDSDAKVARLGRDYEVNRGHVDLNKTNSLQNSAEDFAARGMMRSGAYHTNMAKSNKNFDDQQARMLQNKNDDESQFARAKADYLRGSGTQRQDAKRQQADRNAVENAKRAAQSSS